jgi:hypothetical protein
MVLTTFISSGELLAVPKRQTNSDATSGEQRRREFPDTGFDLSFEKGSGEG